MYRVCPTVYCELFFNSFERWLEGWGCCCACTSSKPEAKFASTTVFRFAYILEYGTKPLHNLLPSDSWSCQVNNIMGWQLFDCCLPFSFCLFSSRTYTKFGNLWVYFLRSQKIRFYLHYPSFPIFLSRIYLDNTRSLISRLVSSFYWIWLKFCSAEPWKMATMQDCSWPVNVLRVWWGWFLVLIWFLLSYSVADFTVRTRTWDRLIFTSIRSGVGLCH